MKTFNELALFAVKNPQLTKSIDPYSAFNVVFDALTEDQREQLSRELAVLYLKFKPPVTSNVKKMSDLELLSKFTGVKDVRYYLNYVYVAPDGKATASSGHYLVTTKQPTALEPGFYDFKTLVNVGDLDGARYPNFSKALQPISNPEIVKLNEVKEIKPLRVDGKDVEAFRLTDADIWFNGEYVKKFQKFFGVDHECQVAVLGGFSQLRLDTDKFYAVLMAVRV